MGEQMQGSVMIFGGNFAPRDWSICLGQNIPISENQALFAIIGTIWGGDGRTNFALPDYRSRVPIGFGQGIGLSQIFQGRNVGQEIYRLSIPEMPVHNHTAQFNPIGGGQPLEATVVVNAHNGIGSTTNPSGNYWATGNAIDGKNVLPVEKTFSTSGGSVMATDAVQVTVTGGSGITGGNVAVDNTGGNDAFPLTQPSLGTNFIMAIEGYFPSRN